MPRRRAQATVEQLALALCVAALLVAGLALGPSQIAAVGDAIRDGLAPATPPVASPGALAFAAAALEPDQQAPAVHDAIHRLTVEVGPEQARTIALALALRRHLPPRPPGRLRPLGDPTWSLDLPAMNGIGPAGDAPVWSTETPRAAPSARLMRRADEEAWVAGLEPEVAERVIEAVAAGAVSIFNSLNPATAAAVLVASAITTADAAPQRGIPAGSREDDLLLCRPVWRTNAATRAWRDGHPFEASRLRLGERIAAVELIVIRAGAPIAHAVLWSHATAC